MVSVYFTDQKKKFPNHEQDHVNCIKFKFHLKLRNYTVTVF